MSEKKFSFNKQDLAGAVRERKPIAADKWVKVVIGSVKLDEKPAKCGIGTDTILLTRLDILDPKDGKSRLKDAPGIFNRLVAPLRDDNVPKYEPPGYASSFWGDFCRSFIDDRHQDEPKPGVDGKLKWKGKLVSRDQLPAIRDELKEALGEEAVKQFSTKGVDLLKRTAFCKTAISEDGLFLNAKSFCSSLPQNAKLASAEELFNVGETSKKAGK